MQALFKKKKSKKKEDGLEGDRARSGSFQEKEGASRQKSSHAFSDSCSDAAASKDRKSLKKLRSKVIAKTVSADKKLEKTDSLDVDGGEIEVSAPPGKLVQTRQLSIDERELFISMTQCEKMISMDSVRLGSSARLSDNQVPRMERQMSVPASDIIARREGSAFVLSTRAQRGLRVETRLLPGDILVSINDSAAEDLSDSALAEILQTDGEVQVTVRSVATLLWMVGWDTPVRAVAAGQVAPSSSALAVRNESPALARSEQELLQERSYLDSRHVWLIHRDGITTATVLDGDDGSPACDFSKTDSTRRVKLGSGEVLIVDDTDVDKINPPSYDYCDNLVVLRQLNESAVLHCLRMRFHARLYHTHAGRHLISIAPNSESAQDLSMGMAYVNRCRAGNTPPHPISVAYQARQRMTQRRRDQTILPLGIAGSGKSFVVSQVLTYLSSTVQKAKGCSLTPQKITDTHSVLQAFSCAVNLIHDNATRISTRFSLSYDANCCLMGGALQTVFFEKSLVTRSKESTLNFHIFYQLWFGADKQLRKDLGFLAYEETKLPCDFLPYLALFTEKQQEEWRQQWFNTCHVLTTLGIGKDEQKGMWMILAAIIHLGMAGLEQPLGASRRPSTSGTGIPPSTPAKATFENRVPAVCAARLLGSDVDELIGYITQSSTGTGLMSWESSAGCMKPSLSSEKINTSTSLAKIALLGPPSSTTSKADNEPANVDVVAQFATGLYEKLFSCVSSLLQKSIEPNLQQPPSYSIHVLDMAGMRFAGVDVRSVAQRFEDLCHNYLHEKLQAVFHQTEFENELHTYNQENVDCNFISTMPPCDPIIDTFERYQVSNPAARGVLYLIEEEFSAEGKRGGNSSFMDRVKDSHGSASGSSDAICHISSPTSFFIRHGQSHMPIEYSTTNWASSIHDNLGTKAAEWCLNDISDGPVLSLMNTRSSSKSLGTPIKRGPSLRAPSGRRVGSRRSVPALLRQQAESLSDALVNAKPFYIFCIRPQSGSTSRMIPLLDVLHTDARSSLTSSQSLLRSESLPMASADIDEEEQGFNVPYVRLQVRKAELISAMRVYRQGFPERISFQDFVRSFQILNPRPPTDETVDDKIAAQNLLEALAVDKSSFRLGCSKIFLKSGNLDHLRATREKQLENTFIQFQAHVRGALVRKHFQLLKVHNVAVRCVQKNVRKLLKVREWPWWKLFTKVVPLLDVHRQDEELKAKDDAITTLQNRVDKLQKETADYAEAKLEITRLQDRVRSLTDCLADEQAAQEQSNEILEQEQMQRLRLEQEVAELQAEHSIVVKQNEQLGLQAAEAMLNRHAFPDNDGDDSDDGESLMNMRIRVLDTEHKRALDAVRAELETEREDNAFAKRQQDKQITLLRSDLDEAYQKSTSMRKKVLRLESELADLRSHLEDEQQRNSILERKQRRFDADLSSAMNAAQNEKDLRAQIMSQKEAETSQRLALDNKLEEVESECDKLRNEIERLREEEESRASHDGVEDELACIRKEKRALMLKLEEQDEELEELASKVHILEQARTRLETGNQLLRQQQQQDLAVREEERESFKASFQRRVRGLEKQLEDEYLMRQNAVKAHRDAELQLMELREHAQHGNPEAERRLRKHLHRTLALLEDAQMQIQGHQKRMEDKSVAKNLKLQIEELGVALSQSKRAKSGLEADLDEAHANADLLRRNIADLESRLSVSNKANMELEARLEETEEDIEEMASKLKNGTEKVAHMIGELETLRCQVEDSNLMHAHLKREKQSLEARVVSLEESCETRTSQHGTYLAKIRVLEDKLSAETVTRRRHENQVARLKEQVDQLTRDETERVNPDVALNLTREKNLRETVSNLEKQEDCLRKKLRESELNRTTAEADLAQSRRQVQQANERITRLHAALRIDDEDMDLLEGELVGDLSDDDCDNDSFDSPVKPRREHRPSITLNDHQMAVDSGDEVDDEHLEAIRRSDLRSGDLAGDEDDEGGNDNGSDN
ncbi:unconventional myosin-XVIIIa-like [Sycon ciliatum]|uniref:unconventional myosin-XVIIIa-like n=1 Tax=Sycon ciliatum TaxID=27933 RepID=UPI0031F66E5E